MHSARGIGFARRVFGVFWGFGLGLGKNGPLADEMFLGLGAGLVVINPGIESACEFLVILMGEDVLDSGPESMRE